MLYINLHFNKSRYFLYDTRLCNIETVPQICTVMARISISCIINVTEKSCVTYNTLMTKMCATLQGIFAD